MNASPSPYIPHCGKVGHPSRRVAVEALRRVLRGIDSAGRDRESLSVFHCDKCGLFHLGNTEHFDRRRKQSKRHESGSRRKLVEYHDE